MYSINNLKVCVLISCMHQKDASIIKRTNIQTDVVVVNQCDENRVENSTFINHQGRQCRVKLIYSTERGLSRSRNTAIANAMGDVCLICDDDEILADDYEEKIVSAFLEYPREHIIAFSIKHPQITNPQKTLRVGYCQSVKISSVQIAFRKCDLVTAVHFCEKMGSGTGNGGGEENKFLVSCLRRGAKIRYVPKNIGLVAQTESQWFKGYTKQYWVNRGWTSRMIYGSVMGLYYVFYCILFRNSKVDKLHSSLHIAQWMMKGFYENR